MSGFTHAAVGANAIWAVPFLGVVEPSVVWLVMVGALGGLLPDVDAVRAKVHFLFGGILSPFRGEHRGIFQHRGIFHSLLAVGAVFAISLLFLRRFHPMLPAVLTISYASHLALDGLNTTAGYLFPFYRKRFALVPRSLRVKVGGAVDQAFFALGVVGLLFFLLAHFNGLLGSGVIETSLDLPTVR